MSSFELPVAAAVGYLWGSVPSAYLLVRFRTGIDLRGHGTGSIGISNAVRQAGMAVFVPLVVYDVFVKAWLPVFLASGVVWDLGAPVQAAVGAGIIAGHNWPVFLKLHGGRGVAPSLGVVLALSWPLLLVFAGTSTVVWVVTRRNTPVAWVIATIAVPVAASIMGLPLAYVVFGITCLAMMLTRRLIGSWPGPRPDLPAGRSRVRVMLNRLVLDRDAGTRSEWIARRPGA